MVSTVMGSEAPLGPVSRLFGAGHVNHFSGSPLNRLSFLRSDHEFLHAALTHPSTAFVVLHDLNPLCTKPVVADQGDGENFTFGGLPLDIETLSYSEVKPVLPAGIYQESEKDQELSWESDVARLPVVFLGVEPLAESPGSFRYKQYFGRPFFAIDLRTNWYQGLRGGAELTAAIDALVAAEGTKDVGASIKRVWPKGRVAFSQHRDYAVYAQARMYLDWNERYRFCGGCGSRNMSVEGGAKLTCPSRDHGVDKPPCPTRGVITNLSFPRTDCVAIICIVNHAGDKVLLGRNKRYPGRLTSVLAGFLEPAESIEECARREAYEEAGVKLGRVVVHSTQPWPYPANIMIGCVGEIADPSPESHRIFLGHDPELEHAQWYSFEDVRKVLAGDTTLGFTLPPEQAIAHHLLRVVVDDDFLKTELESKM